LNASATQQLHKKNRAKKKSVDTKEQYEQDKEEILKYRRERCGTIHRIQILTFIQCDELKNLLDEKGIQQNYLDMTEMTYLKMNCDSFPIVLSINLSGPNETRKRKNLQFALHAHACSLRCTLGAIRSGTRYAK
jgi:hypothetical protein